MRMIAAAPLSSAPNSERGTSMKPAPRNAAAPPVAVATEFIVTTCWRGTTSGSAADSPDATNRVNPLAINAPNRICGSLAPAASSAAMASISTSRPRLAPTSTSRLSQRSSNAPANGPSTEYGRYRTANAATISHGPAARSGLNSRPPASPAWNRPSPNWLTVRNSSSRQNSGRLRTDRHRATGACASTTRIHTTNIRAGRRCSLPSTFAGDIMEPWRSQRIRRISSPRRRTGYAQEPCCWPTPICSSRRFVAASST